MDRASDELPRFARAAIEFDDGSRVILDDSRALSTLDLHAANAPPDLGLGPEPGDRALTAESLRAVLAKKRGPIKPVLLDQRVIAGLGNIYAAEALWHARSSPTHAASSLTSAQVTRCSRRFGGDRARDGCALHGLVGVAARRVRSRRASRAGVPDADRADRAGGAVDVLLSALPGSE